MIWTKVMEETPPPLTTLLLYTSVGEVKIGGYKVLRWLNKNSELATAIECQGVSNGENIILATHWMPLPKEPED